MPGGLLLAVVLLSLSPAGALRAHVNVGVVANRTDAAEASGADVAHMTVESSSNGCGCSASVWSYMRWPLSQAGSGCIGGCGGGPFQVNLVGGTVQRLAVWTHSAGHIKAIRVGYFDSTQEIVVGNPAGGRGPHLFTFQPGETVEGDLHLSGNGRGQRLGFIRFTTNAGRSFEVGMNNIYRYLFPSGNSYIASLVGRAGDDIDSMGVLFWRPVREVSYINIRYPTLDTLARLQSPTQIDVRTYCNDNNEARPFARSTTTRQISTGQESCFTSTTSAQFGQTVTVKAGVPALAETTAQTSWQVSQSLTFNNCNRRTVTETRVLEFPAITLAPRTRTRYTYSQWQGRLNRLPFEADVLVVFTDGTSFRRTERGAYTGVSYTSVHQAWSGQETNVARC